MIDFTARLFDLNKKEAAEKLAQDFGVIYDSRAPPHQVIQAKSDAQKYKEAEQHCFRVLADYLHLLRKWETELSPTTPEDSWHPQFIEALKMKAHVEYLLDMFIDGDIKERAAWIAEHGKDVMKLERRISELTAGAESGSHENSRLYDTQDCRRGQKPSGPD